MKTTHPTHRLVTLRGMLAAAGAASILVMGAAGCEPREGPMERAGKQVDRAAERAGDKIEEAGKKIEGAAKK